MSQVSEVGSDLHYSCVFLGSQTLQLETNISMSLSNTSSRFCRPMNCISSNYYYQAFPFNVSATGVYAISSSSTIDTYGFLYMNSFTPSNSSANLIAYSDDDAGERQFLLSLSLTAAFRYILVVTTYEVNVFGLVVILIRGAGTFTIIP